MKKRFSCVTNIWRAWALGVALMAAAGWTGTAMAQTHSEKSFVDRMDEAADAVVDNSNKVNNDSSKKLTKEIVDKLQKAVKEGKDLEYLARYSDDIGKASKALKVLDIALNIIKMGGLSKETIQAWNAGDRQGFIDAFNKEVLAALKLGAAAGGGWAGGALAGAALGSVVPGAGTVAGAVVGGIGGVVGGILAEMAAEALYKEFLEDFIEEKAGELFDSVQPGQGERQPALPGGGGQGGSSGGGGKPASGSGGKRTFSPIDI